MAPKMVHFGSRFGDFLVTFSGHRSLIDFGMHFDRLLAAFWLPLGSLWLPSSSRWRPFARLGRPLGSLLAPFGVLLASFCSPWASFWLQLAIFWRPLLHFLTFDAPKLHFYVSPSEIRLR